MDIWAQIALTGLVSFVPAFLALIIDGGYSRFSHACKALAIAGLAAIAVGFLGAIWS